MNVLGNSIGQKQNELLQLMDVTEVEQINLNSSIGIQFMPIEGSQDYHWFECVKYSQSLEDSQSILTNLQNDPNESIRDILVIEHPGFNSQEECLPAQPIKHESTFLSGNRREIVLETTNPGWLMISSTYYPGWIALIDGKVVQIYAADIAFQAIQVTAGRHTIQFFYKPLSCYYGAILSGMTFLGIFILSVVNNKKKKEEEHGNQNHK
jgi:hypothetical protein